MKKTGRAHLHRYRWSSSETALRLSVCLDGHVSQWKDPRSVGEVEVVEVGGHGHGGGGHGHGGGGHGHGGGGHGHGGGGHGHGGGGGGSGGRETSWQTAKTPPCVCVCVCWRWARLDVSTSRLATVRKKKRMSVFSSRASAAVVFAGTCKSPWYSLSDIYSGVKYRWVRPLCRGRALLSTGGATSQGVPLAVLGKGRSPSSWCRSMASDATDGGNGSGNTRIPKDGGTSGMDDQEGGSGKADATGYRGMTGEEASPRVCIVGGGFGGLYTAIKLDQLLWPPGKKPRVTLVDQHDRFSFKPLLYDVLVGSATEDEVAPTYSSLLGSSSVTFVQGTVSGVENDIQCVRMRDGGKIPYDWLVMALGATSNTFGVQGVEEHALQFSTFEDATKLKRALERFGPNEFPEICIVGGGYAGVELAAALTDLLKGMCRVQIVTSASDILVSAPDGQRMAAKDALDNDGVSVICDTLVEKIQVAGGEGGKRILQTRKRSSSSLENLEADIVLWTAGQSPAILTEHLEKYIPFKLNEYGAMETDRTLKVLDTERVFALGDVAITQCGEQEAERQLPTTAQVALQQADYVAWNIWASINKKPLLNFRYQHLGNMMSLGSTKGAVSVPIPVPPPISAAIKSGPLGDVFKAFGVSVDTTFGGASDGITIQGPFGALLRRAAYLYRQPTDSQRLNVVSSWAQLAQENLIKRK